MTDDSWKQTHLRDPNRRPLAECPHCDWKAYSVVSAWGKASHMWKCHGVPGKFTMNGRTIRYGPDSKDPDPVIHLKEFPVKPIEIKEGKDASVSHEATKPKTIWEMVISKIKSIRLLK